MTYSTLDILPTVMPLRIPSFPELFHCGIVFLLRCSSPRPLRSLKDSISHLDYWVCVLQVQETHDYHTIILTNGSQSLHPKQDKKEENSKKEKITSQERWCLAGRFISRLSNHFY